MPTEPHWLTELYRKTKHDVSGFSCNAPKLDYFLKNRAGHFDRCDWGKTYVCCLGGTRQVIGYYTISVATIQADEAPLEKQAPVPVPVLHLGRLAVDINEQQSGVGKYLVAEVMQRAVRLANEVGLCGINVHARHDSDHFYKKMGFVNTCGDDEHHLFIHIQTVRQAFAAASDDHQMNLSTDSE